MPDLSDRLLRTFASVPATSRVLDFGCGQGIHTAPLLLLGFDVYAWEDDEHMVSAVRTLLSEKLDSREAERRVSYFPRLDASGHPGALFDWVVAFDLSDKVSSREELVGLLREVHRLLVPGGWVYLAVRSIPAHFNPLETSADYASDSGPAFTFTSDTLNAVAEEAWLAVADPPEYTETDRPRLEGIYRRVEAGTIR
jgi:SAM-dependent methyltransferase